MSNGWRDRHVVEEPAPFTVEKALNERLQSMREAMVREAEANGWDTVAVDRVLTEGSLAPMTREFIVQYTESVDKEIRVRAKDKAHASQIAGVDGVPGTRLVAVKEVPESGVLP